MDEDSYIKIHWTDQRSDHSRGMNISPVEIENVLFSHPKVLNAAVVGMPDPRLGERVCAFVILRTGETLSLEEIRQWMTDAGVAKPKWPERIEPLPVFPMTPSGKVQKFRLREMLSKVAVSK